LLEERVEPWAVNVWRNDSPGKKSTGHTLPHCQDPSIYTSKTDGQFSYAPTFCKVLPNEEAHFIDQSKLFLATFIDDVLVWEGMGDRCGAASQHACQENAGAVYEEVDDGRCSCKFHEQSIVEDAEEQLVRFVYGYEVDLSHGKRKDVHRNGILSSKAARDDKALVTRFLATDGTDCKFGGKSHWQQSESVGGISGTLNELLACAGVTLDADPSELVPGTLSSSPQHLRTSGLKLSMYLDLHQDHLGHITSEVRVEATPVTTFTWNDAIQPATSSRMGTVSRRLRRAHGVSFDVHVVGHIYTFNWFNLVRGCVDMLVLMQIPSVLVQFVAMYLMGVTSEIYRHTARTKLNIFGKFHNLVAKLMLGEVAFRGLLSNFSSPIEDLDCLTPQLLLSRLKDVFSDLCRTGKLQPEEIVRMAAVVFTTMDTDNSGAIGPHEFISACTDDGEITMQRMAKYFHKGADSRFHSLRKYLDDTHLAAHRVSKKCAHFAAMSGVLPDGDEDEAHQLPKASNLDLTMKSEQVDVDSVIVTRNMMTHGSVESIVANLEKRLQAQEEQCERALGLLRDVCEQQVLTSGMECPLRTPRSKPCVSASRSKVVSSGKVQEMSAQLFAPTFKRGQSNGSDSNVWSHSTEPEEGPQSREDTMTALGFITRS